MFEGLTLGHIATVIICLLISITIHEFMHAYVGYRLGDNTAFEDGRVSFNPLRHIDPLMTVLLPAVTLLLFQVPILAAKPVPFNPARLKYDEYGAALLALAGPVSNLALAFLGALLFKVVDFGGLTEAMVFFVQINVALFIFNMIPIPPLDGSRVLYAFAPEPLRRLLEQLEPIGFFIIIALFVWGGLGGFLGTLNQFVLNLLP